MYTIIKHLYVEDGDGNFDTYEIWNRTKYYTIKDALKDALKTEQKIMAERAKREEDYENWLAKYGYPSERKSHFLLPSIRKTAEATFLRFNNIPTDKITEEWEKGWINSLHELKEKFFKRESYLASFFTQYEIIELDFLPIKY